MDDESSSPVSDLPAAPTQPAAPTLSERIVALIEVLLCSDYPTQLAVGQTLFALGIQPLDAGRAPNITFVVALSLLDTIFLVGLIVMFLRARGESVRHVFLGGKPWLAEVRLGVPLTVAAFALAFVVMFSAQSAAPWLRTVEHNPLQELLRTPLSAALFALVVVVAGGVREELQRAFLLRRFEQALGGRAVGVTAVSIAFGVGHTIQGYDAVVTTAVLGAFWGVVYLRRRSVVAPMMSHAGFDLLQIAQFLARGR
jgi:membrane protease YdiL (CAAX protease family)